MLDTMSELARRLAANAEAVCRHYLSNGRRVGGYWLVGDVHNTPGRSLYVRLRGPPAGTGAAGKWTDAATGEHGDLLDLIAAARGLRDVGDVLDEARRFLGLAQATPDLPASAGSPEAARRLFASSRPIGGTLAEAYLRERGIDPSGDTPALRFHPRCFYRPDEDSSPGERTAWPALLAAVTDLAGAVTGVQRTWLDPAPAARRRWPRRGGRWASCSAMRSASPRPEPAMPGVLAAGEGIETVLSLGVVLPTLPLAAALSAGHLAALQFPAELRRLYIARDNDHAGEWAAGTLTARAQAAGIEAIVLEPSGGDFNDDLRQFGPHALTAALRVQLAPEDVKRFRSQQARR